MGPFPNLAETTVVVANSAQRTALGKLAAQNFSPKWDIDEYMRIWDEVPKNPWFAEGRVITWALVRRGQEEGTAFALAQTERIDAFSKDSSGAVERINVYGMTYVNTPKEYQRQGYSRHLLRTIHYFLSPSLRPTWPTSWGSYPTLSEKTLSNLPEGPVSILTTAAAPLHYFKCWIGPDDNQRPGWVGRGLEEASENMELFWDLSESTAFSSTESRATNESDGKGKEYSLLYQKDIPRLTGALSMAARRRLEGSPNPPQGSFTVMLDPATPGWFWWHIDQTPRLGLNAVRPSADPSIPIGIVFHSVSNPVADHSIVKNADRAQPVDARLSDQTDLSGEFKTRSNSNSTSIITSIQPSDGIIVFQPRCFYPDEISILLTSNLTEDQMKQAIPIMISISNSNSNSFSHDTSQDGTTTTAARHGNRNRNGEKLSETRCTKLRLWGLKPDDPVVRVLTSLGGVVRDRTETRFLPLEVCDYRSHGKVKFERMEIWGWC